MEINRFRNQWDKDMDDNFGSTMPILIYRVTWKNEGGIFQELWTESKESALKKKYEIDHSDGKMTYVNYEGWFAYRTDEHDKRFGRIPRDREWWDSSS
jgi:hypothetical protein